jgi:hypothetical protein
MQLEPFRPDRLLARLSNSGVDYVVIGGIAAQAHGSPQFTGDVDICYATDEANLERLGRVLVALGARVRGVAEDLPFVPDERTLRRTQILALDTPDGKLDLLAAPSGSPGYAALAADAVIVEWAGATIKVASLAHLIAMKNAAGGPKDLIAVEELEAIQRILREESG